MAWGRHYVGTLSALLLLWLVDSSRRGASNVYLWCFLCCQTEQTVEQTIELPRIWDAMTLMWCHCNGLYQHALRSPNLQFIDAQIMYHNKLVIRQSGHVITLSIITLYWIQHCNDSVKYRSDFELMKDTPYVTLTSELCDVTCHNYGEKMIA